MKTNALVTWLSPLAVALLAFGSQIALAQDAPGLSRAEVRAEALQAQASGAIERQRMTSYSTNANWGPGAPAFGSERARLHAESARAEAARAEAARADKRATGDASKKPARNPA